MKNIFKYINGRFRLVEEENVENKNSLAADIIDWFGSNGITINSTDVEDIVQNYLQTEEPSDVLPTVDEPFEDEKDQLNVDTQDSERINNQPYTIPAAEVNEIFVVPVETVQESNDERLKPFIKLHDKMDQEKVVTFKVTDQEEIRQLINISEPENTDVQNVKSGSTITVLLNKIPEQIRKKYEQQISLARSNIEKYLDSSKEVPDENRVDYSEQPSEEEIEKIMAGITPMYETKQRKTLKNKKYKTLTEMKIKIRFRR